MGDVNINRAQNQLNRTIPTDDAVICMVFSGTAVANNIALGAPQQIFGSDALATLGITADNNPVAFRDITDFYAKAGEGAELNFMLVSDATQLADICDVANPQAKKLMDFTQGRGVVLLVNVLKPAGYNGVAANGLDSDVWAALTKLNAFASAYQKANTPFVAVLPGIGFLAANVAQLPSRDTMANDYVAINLACELGDGHISMGALAGRIAAIQVSRSIGRKLDGSMFDSGFFPDGTSVTALKDSIVAIAKKGFIVLRQYTGTSGYFYYDDPTFTASKGDFTSISWNRVINKAQRIAYTGLSDHLNDDVDEDPTTGKISPSLIADWESDAENAIRDDMMNLGGTKVKEISGVKVTIDPNSDILNDQMDATISIVRKGQVKNINVNIGYVQSIQ